MKKGFWTAGALCLTIGIVLFVVGGFFSSRSKVYQTVERSFSGGIRGISIDCSAEDVYLRPSTDNQYHVFCSGSEETEFSIEVIEGILTVTSDQEFLENLAAWDFENQAKITVQLPVGNSVVPLESVTVSTASGDVLAAEKLLLRRCEITTASGAVSFRAAVQGRMRIESTSGDIFVEDPSKTPAYEFILSSTSGDLTLKGQTVSAIVVESTSGDMLLEDCEFGTLTANSVSGEIDLAGVDAEECYIQTTSGDVSAGLRRAMDFHCSSTSGDIETPASVSGGLCQIDTTSGDIKVWIDSRNSVSQSDQK